MVNLIGQSLGRYHILEQLGEGGMATVYKAFDTRLERDVAIKVIRRDAFPPSQLDRILKRFEREAKALAKLSHLHIIKVIDYGEHEGSPYLVMEYLPGGTLKQRLGKPMAWQDAVQLLIPIADALEYAHEHNIIHRDIKPSNILLTAKGQPMLTDFGIAKILESEETATLTGTGVGMGTPEYMAPEQWTGQATTQSDIYSLGVVLYEMVTGRKPFTADTPAAILLKQATEPLPRPAVYVRDLPEVFEKVLVKALTRKPEDRYKNIEMFRQSLENLLRGTTKGMSAAVQVPLSKPAKPALQKQTAALQKETASTRIQTITNEPPRKLRTTEPAHPPVAPGQKQTRLRALWIGIGGVLFLVLFGIIGSTMLAGIFAPAATEPPTAAPLIVEPPAATEAPALELPVLFGTPIPYPYAGISVQNAGEVQQLAQWGKGTVNAISWSPDGSLFALATSRGIRLHGGLTLRQIRFIPYTAPVNSVAFSPDGKTLAAGSSDGMVTIWETAGGRLLNSFAGHTYSVNSVAFSPDGQKIASGSSDKTIQIWRASNGELLRILEGHTESVTSIAFSPDSRTLASGAWDKTVRLWRVADGTLLKTLTGHTDGVASVTYSPDGEALASSAYDQSIIIWNSDPATQRCSAQLDNGRSASLSFSPDGGWLAGDALQLARIWDAGDCSLMQTVEGPTGGLVQFSPDGRWLLAVEQFSYNIARVRVGVWSIDKVQEWNPPYGYSIAVSPIEEIVAVFNWTAAGGIIELRQSSDGALVRTIGPDPVADSVMTFSPDGQVLAVGSGETVLLWQVSSGELLQTLNGSAGGKHGATFSPDGTTLAAMTDQNNIDVWSLSTGALLHTMSGHTEWIHALAFTPDGGTLASGSYDDTVKLWRLSDGVLTKTLEGHGADVEDVAFSPDGRYLASGGDDSNIHLWRVSDGTLLHTFMGHTGWVWTVAFSPDGELLASGSGDKTINLWRVTDQQLLQTLTGHTDNVFKVVFGLDGRTLVSGSGDGTIAIWGIAP